MAREISHLGVIRIVSMTVRSVSASRHFNSPLHAFVFVIGGGDGFEEPLDRVADGIGKLGVIIFDD